MTVDYDLVLFGATGFTGSLTASHLAERAPEGLRWAVAGRNRTKLEALAARLAGSGAGGIGVVVADSSDPAQLRAVAESSRVVATTVGPYTGQGEALVAACAAAGTDYLDITGEPEFIDRSWLLHHATAVRTGARLVHACGFDSVPHDLGAQFAVEQLPADAPIRLSGYVSASGAASGGTFASALTAMGRLRQSAAAQRERRELEAAPPGRRVRAVTGRPGHVAQARDGGAWVLPLPTVDPQVVARSAAALPGYGPDFAYSHYLALGNPLALAAVAAGTAGLIGMAQTGPTRRALQRLLPTGTGPDEARRARHWFRVRMVGGVPDGPSVVAEVAGGDPGYGDTAKMLGEAALCLACDDLPASAGQVTTAEAMGAVLRGRLETAGITFRLLPK